MTEPFIAQIQSFGFNFAPRGWGNCDNTWVPKSQNESLYSLIGTTYGGNASNAALPDLRGRVALNQGQGPGLTNRWIGVRGGAEEWTLQTKQLPAHNHTIPAHNHQIPAHNHQLRATSQAANSPAPATTKLLGVAAQNIYAPPTGSTLIPLDNAANVQAISVQAAGPTSNTTSGPTANTGGGEAYTDMQPFQVINICIALVGMYPSRN